MEFERILGPCSPKIGCENADLFEDDSVTDSQLLCYAEAPTQDEEPEGLVQSPEVEVIPPSEAMEGIESQQSAPLRDGQDIIRQGDQDNSSSSGEPPLGQGDPKEVESGPHRLEPTEQEIQDYSQELKKESSFLEIVEAITCHAPILRQAIAVWGLSESTCSGAGISQCVVLCGRSIRFLRGSKTYRWFQSNRVVWTVVCGLTNWPYPILGHSNHSMPCANG